MKLSAWYGQFGLVQKLEMDCGCVFVNGMASSLCSNAIVKDGVLYHRGSESPSTNNSSVNYDKDFLRSCGICE